MPRRPTWQSVLDETLDKNWVQSRGLPEDMSLLGFTPLNTIHSRLDKKWSRLTRDCHYLEVSLRLHNFFCQFPLSSCSGAAPLSNLFLIWSSQAFSLCCFWEVLHCFCCQLFSQPIFEVLQILQMDPQIFSILQAAVRVQCLRSFGMKLASVEVILPRNIC